MATQFPIDPEFGRFVGGEPPDQDEEAGVEVEMPRLDDSELEELPDGSVVVHMTTKGPREDEDFYENLADSDDFNPMDIDTLALRYSELVEKDKEARKQRD